MTSSLTWSPSMGRPISAMRCSSSSFPVRVSSSSPLSCCCSSESIAYKWLHYDCHILHLYVMIMTFMDGYKWVMQLLDPWTLQRQRLCTHFIHQKGQWVNEWNEQLYCHLYLVDKWERLSPRHTSMCGVCVLHICQICTLYVLVHTSVKTVGNSNNDLNSIMWSVLVNNIYCMTLCLVTVTILWGCSHGDISISSIRDHYTVYVVYTKGLLTRLFFS